MEAEVLEQVAPEKKETMKPKAVDLSDLNVQQRVTLKQGVRNAIEDSPQFKALGSAQRITLFDTLDMIRKPEGLKMLDVSGKVYWKKAPVPGGKSEDTRFIQFQFEYSIPGTRSSVISVTKEWRYEDFK